MSTTKQHIDDGGTAFPHTTVNNMGGFVLQPGMSLRDWFAGQAMTQFIGFGAGSDDEYFELVARALYKMADAMIAARKGGSHE
jgi:hypothetical protein